MTTTHQILFVSLLSSAAAQAGAGPRTDVPDEGPILIRMINSSHLSDQLLRQGAKTARRIFNDAGVRTVWVNCTARESGPGRDPQCAREVDATDIVVRILAKKQAKRYELPKAALGVAIVPPDQFGALANVFSHRVDEIARWTGVDEITAVGHILAHEAGHLLLHQPQHSERGLMRAAWSRAQLKAAQTRSLQFSASELRRLHRNVAERVTSAGR